MGRGRQRLLPHRRGGRAVDQVAGVVDGPARRLVVVGERPGAVAGRGGTVGRQGLELPGQIGEVEPEGHRVVKPVEGGSVAGYPPVHRPPVRVAVVGFSDRDRLGYGDRQVRGEPGQPRRLPVDLARRPVDARQAHHEVLTQAPDAVGSAPRLDDGERPVGQIGHLRREESADERVVQLDLLVVHAHHHDDQPSLRRRRVGVTAPTLDPAAGPRGGTDGRRHW